MGTNHGEGQMQHANTRRRMIAVVTIALFTSCRPTPSEVPATPPSYGGQVSGTGFQSGTSGLGELTLLRLSAAPGTAEIPLGFARIDGSTKFIFNRRPRIDSTQVGLPGLQWAHVRVWYRGAPTSRTSSEIWGNAQLVVVDSAGRRPLRASHNATHSR